MSGLLLIGLKLVQLLSEETKKERIKMPWVSAHWLHKMSHTTKSRDKEMSITHENLYGPYVGLKNCVNMQKRTCGKETKHACATSAILR